MDGRNLMRVRVRQLEPNSLTRDRRVPQSAPGRREHSNDEARIKLRSRRLEQDFVLPRGRGFRFKMHAELWHIDSKTAEFSDDACTRNRAVLRSLDASRHNQLIRRARRTFRLLHTEHGGGPATGNGDG